jgi:hypothetical protein
MMQRCGASTGVSVLFVIAGVGVKSPMVPIVKLPETSEPPPMLKMRTAFCALFEQTMPIRKICPAAVALMLTVCAPSVTLREATCSKRAPLQTTVPPMAAPPSTAI